MADRDLAVEQWLIRRGVPHFIDDYAATTDIWTRSIPVLVIAYLVGGLNALDLHHWSWQRNVLAAMVVVVILVGGWIATNLGRGRRALARPDTVGTPELATFLVGPVVPSLLFAQWGDALQALLEGAVVLVVVYLATSYAVVALLGWAVRRSAAQLAALASLVVRALPLLLLFTTFLFINAEVWQVAGTLTGPAYVATLAIFFLLGAVFVLSRVPGIMRRLASFDDWGDVRAAVGGTPAEHLHVPAAGPVPDHPLTRRQRLNVGLVAVFSQALQITFVAILLTLFFVLFGFLAIPVETTEAWTGLERAHVLVDWQLGGDGRTLAISESLLRVAGFLGAFTGMYFTVVLSTDATYRDEFAEDVGPPIRQALAARLVYVTHLRSRDARPTG